MAAAEKKKLEYRSLKNEHQKVELVPAKDFDKKSRQYVLATKDGEDAPTVSFPEAIVRRSD